MTTQVCLAQSAQRKARKGGFGTRPNNHILEAIDNPFNSILDKIDIKINEQSKLHFR